MGNLDIFQLIRLNENEKFFYLVDSIDINLENEFHQNLLHEAVAQGNLAIATKLIGNGINIDHKDCYGKTPLHYAAEYDQIELAEIILRNGGSLNISDDYGNEPLWTAVFNARGKYEIVKLFINFRARPNHKNKAGRSPLDFALQIDDQDLIKTLKFGGHIT